MESLRQHDDASSYEPREVSPKYLDYVYTDEVPLFYGHYWRSWEPAHTEDWTRYTACVDFSAVKSGHLVAYRFSGEPTILRDNHVPHTRDVVAPSPSA